MTGEFDEATLEDLSANPDVLSIEEDGLMSIFTTVTQYVLPRASSFFCSFLVILSS